ncbi:MAG: response regulator [Lachnospiraceae bacterium]|nr:response regulator [Lachnospiraceae bacterium]
MVSINNRKKTGRNILISFAMIMAILASLLLFMRTNTQRIISQNESYIADATILSADHVNNRFASKISNIQMIAALYGEDMNSPTVDVDRILELCPKGYFDRISFIPADGQYLTSSGETVDLTTRESYINGIRGKSGVCTANDYWTTESAVLSFYTPMYYKGEIIGVLCGLYDAKGIESVISNEFFGATACVYLCTGDGTVIITAGDDSPPDNILEAARTSDDFFGETQDSFFQAFDNHESHSFTYINDSGTENAYIAVLEYNDWILIQSFPAGIAADMLHRANNAGIVLCGSIILAFLTYIILLLIAKRRNEISLTNENEKNSNIVESVTAVFSRFAVVDLKNDDYYYVAKTDGMPPKGKYTDLIQYVSQFYIPEEDYVTMSEVVMPEHIQKTMTEDLAYLQYEYHINRGVDKWENLSLICLKREEGKPVSILYAVQDITERKSKEFASRVALQEAFDAAEAANNAKSEFLSRMSHDIRTPMNAVMGMTAIAATNMDDRERVADCLNKITASSRHLLALINDVLDMSKIESGKITINEEPFNLSEMIEGIFTIMQPQFKAKNQKISIRTSNIVHEDLIGDTLRLRQVFVNIMGNSAKFTPDGGHVSLDISELDSQVPGKACYEFIFADTGIGMEQSFIDEIFEPFSRSKNPNSQKIEGTGLGMAIAKNIVNMMDGDIKVESKVGEGSKFTVRVFLTIQELNETDADLLESLRILVADDDEISADSTREVLSSIGMDATSVYSGEDAVAEIVRHHERGEDFAAVILDWQMPNMDGVQATAEIRRKVGDEIPVIILSAYDWTDIEQEARDIGVNAFVAKPLFRSRLIYVLRNLVGQAERSTSTDVDLLDENKFSGKRILVVDDIDLNREIAGELLTMNGILVEYAFDGKMAVDTLEEKPANYFDLVFMDIQMPNMNGYEATRAIRASDREDLKTIPIIAMSADAFSDDVYKSKESGMNAHISKPIDIPRLMDTLAMWLG